VLAVVGSIVGDQPHILVVVNILAANLAVLVSYLFARRFLPPVIALIPLAVVAVHPGV
jgi:hypothetical protein